MIEEIKDEHGLPKDNGVFRISYVSAGIDDDGEVFFRLDLRGSLRDTILLLERKFMVELLDVLDADSFIEDVCAFLRGQYVHVTTKYEGGLAPIETIGDVFEQRCVRFSEESK